MRRIPWAAACWFAAAAMFPSAFAASPASPAGPARLTVGAGGSGFRDSPNAAHFAVTYHHRPFVSTVRPLIGALGSTQGDTFLFAGTSFDLPVAQWGATPMLTAGFYDRGGGGMNLGGAFEFRSGIEIYRRIGRRARLGVSLHHISNAGLFEKNPGRESIFLSGGFDR